MADILNKELLEKAKQDNVGHAEELVEALNSSADSKSPEQLEKKA